MLADNSSFNSVSDDFNTSGQFAYQNIPIKANGLPIPIKPSFPRLPLLSYFSSSRSLQPICA